MGSLNRTVNVGDVIRSTLQGFIPGTRRSMGKSMMIRSGTVALVVDTELYYDLCLVVISTGEIGLIDYRVSGSEIL